MSIWEEVQGKFYKGLVLDMPMEEELLGLLHHHGMRMIKMGTTCLSWERI
jgi:hypothetical protein